MAITIDNVSKDVPVDDWQEQKVVDYNAIFAAMQAAWTPWTPTLANMTLGNGTVTAKFRQIGKLVHARFSFVLGSTSTVGTAPTFTLPVTRAALPGTATLFPLGLLTAYDLSATTGYNGFVDNSSTTTTGLRIANASGTYLTFAAVTATIPFTWATGDEIHTEFFYEAA